MAMRPIRMTIPISLPASDYASDWQTDESYTYDDNGNRTNTGYSTGDHNRLTSDGTYNYTYDNEGNVLTKTNISTSESVEYTWDHRNRLIKVTFKNSGGTATKIVEYAYDHGQRWVRKTLDTNADGTIESSQVFVHDNGQIVLDFQKTGTAAASNSDLANRYLWGTNVDELLADELVDDGTEDDNRWALTDHLNSVRDLVAYNPVTGTVSVVKHVAYDAFGNVTSDSATAVKSLFLYTARPFDPDTDLQNNLNRWYNLSTGRWMSVDPIGFEARDVNLYRYVGNAASSLVDPNGLQRWYCGCGRPVPNYKPNPFYGPYGHPWPPLPSWEPDFGTEEWEQKWGSFNPWHVYYTYLGEYMTRLSRWQKAWKNGIHLPPPVDQLPAARLAEPRIATDHRARSLLLTYRCHRRRQMRLRRHPLDP
jgi:RHS repeat-associated protein